MIRTRSLQFSYHNSKKFQFPDITLQDGEELLVLGESGIGKTTLVHLMAGLLQAESGSIELGDINISCLSPAKMDHFRGQHIGLVFQRPHFINALCLRENLLLIQFLAGADQDLDHIRLVLNRLGMGEKLQEKPNRLSQGEQQRAAIAMALINQPSLILADEPTSSLDDKNCFKVVGLLQEQASLNNAHLIIITHDRRLKARFQNFLTL